MDERRHYQTIYARAANEIAETSKSIRGLEETLQSMDGESSMAKRYAAVLEEKKQTLANAKRIASDALQRLEVLTDPREGDEVPSELQGVRRSLLSEDAKSKIVSQYGIDAYMRLPR